jgi:putative salt-induced outer membrane protein
VNVARKVLNMTRKIFNVVTRKIFLVQSSCFLITFGTGTLSRGATATNAPPKSPPWDATASVGLTLTRGNSKTVLFTGNLQAAKKWQKNELNLGLDGVYGENNDVESAESIRGFGQFNRLFSERAFGYLRVEALHDGIANIDYRLTVSPGGGYYFLKTTNTTLRAEIGPGYIYEKIGSATVNGEFKPSHSKSYMTLRVAERFDHKLNDRVKIWQTAEYLPQVDQFSNYIINAEVGIETAMTKHLSQQTLLQNSYDNDPAPGRHKNDLKLIAALKYKF